MSPWRRTLQGTIAAQPGLVGTYRGVLAPRCGGVGAVPGRAAWKEPAPRFRVGWARRGEIGGLALGLLGGSGFRGVL